MMQTNTVCNVLQRKLKSLKISVVWINFFLSYNVWSRLRMENETDEKSRNVLWLSYLVDCLLTLFVLLGLLLNLLPLFNIVNKREEVAQVNDERLRLDVRSGERRKRKKRLWKFKKWNQGEGNREGKGMDKEKKEIQRKKGRSIAIQVSEEQWKMNMCRQGQDVEEVKQCRKTKNILKSSGMTFIKNLMNILMLWGGTFLHFMYFFLVFFILFMYLLIFSHFILVNQLMQNALYECRMCGCHLTGHSLRGNTNPSTAESDDNNIRSIKNSNKKLRSVSAYLLYWPESNVVQNSVRTVAEC